MTAPPHTLAELAWRGLVHQTTDEKLGEWLDDKPRTVYVGFDPTADSLHVGSLLGLVVLRRLQQRGHTPVAVVGGATGMIGDPSGKSAERNLLSTRQLERNVEGLASQMRGLLDFDCGPASARLVNNHDWAGRWSYLGFLRDIGKNFPVNVMLAKDSVKARLGSEAGLSYTEFSYMLLQAYDFVHLHRELGCELQAGGSDQWGNITAGIDLARRMDGATLRGLTWPLLTKADGTKMGKTESGAVWLDARRTGAYDFYQYWMRTDDADVGACLRKLTDLTRNEIEELDAAREQHAAGRDSQRRLAEELTRLVHGDEGLSIAERATQVFFGAEISQLDDRQLTAIFADVPSRELPRSRLVDGSLTVIEALTESGLAKSKSDARRTIASGGAYVNNRRAPDPAAVLTERDLASETVLVLRAGKRKYALLRFCA